jgi:hypothetical protein
MLENVMARLEEVDPPAAKRMIAITCSYPSLTVDVCDKEDIQ